ncbi:MAG: DUF4249 family protein [Bacteroidota bacterium]|nr:DUF4249 family protein [Bacteroidota bacterium]MDP4229830.1 DUF4249 family protein [Bacteroidota bacterium]MDP4236189.1 DUF4249 family protein [Bacteroidota bacterium]
MRLYHINKIIGIWAIGFIFVTGLVGCDGAIESQYQEQVVVEGFIYPGGGIDSVILHYTTPFTLSYDDSTYAITDADVRVSDGANEYVLLPRTARGRYYLPASTLRIQSGKTYSLTVRVKDHVVSAHTTVPAQIKYLNLDSTLPKNLVLLLDTVNPSSFSYQLIAGPVDVPTRRYMLEVSAQDTNYGKVATNLFGPPVDTSAYVRYSFIQTGPVITLYSRLFGWYGPNNLTFLALDSNWVDYKRQVGYGERAQIHYQSSLNHVTGGIGVWASAARDVVQVFLKPKP